MNECCWSCPPLSSSLTSFQWNDFCCLKLSSHAYERLLRPPKPASSLQKSVHSFICESWPKSFAFWRVNEGWKIHFSTGIWIKVENDDDSTKKSLIFAVNRNSWRGRRRRTLIKLRSSVLCRRCCFCFALSHHQTHDDNDRRVVISRDMKKQKFP